jgi:hypothetical protein
MRLKKFTLESNGFTRGEGSLKRWYKPAIDFPDFIVRFHPIEEDLMRPWVPRIGKPQHNTLMAVEDFRFPVSFTCLRFTF